MARRPELPDAANEGLALIYLPHEIPQEWRDLLLLIPGYDCIATAEDAWFDSDAAQLALDFFPDCLRHVEGDLANQPFVLQPWQKAIVACLFGWLRVDEVGRTIRRYREVLLYVPRKNGKTPFASGIALLILFTDREVAQQNFVAAKDREQAGKLFRHCKEMVKKEPELNSRCRIYGGNAAAGQSRSIVLKSDGSFLRIISADSDSAHGDNMHAGFVDELHVQQDRDLIDAMQSATASLNRSQPLLFCLTTADHDRPSICNEKHDYACKVRDGSTTKDGFKDAKFLPVIYEANRDDPFDDEKVWAKANPNLGVSVSLQFLRDECKRAKEIFAYESAFRRLYLNQRTTTAEKVIPMNHWYACGGTIDRAKLKGRMVHVGLDIGATSDFTAMANLFPHDDAEEVKIVILPDELPKDEKDKKQDGQQLTRTIIRRSYTLLMHFWLPETPVKRNPRLTAQIEAWRKQGLITTTSGDVVDYDLVLEDMQRILAPYDVVDIAFDRGFQGSQMGTNLMKTWGDKVESFAQGILSMNAPFREFIELLPVKRLHHEGHPVMNWMVSNTVAERKGGLMKPSKDKSPEKIDGVSALTMTIGRALKAACKPIKKYASGSLRN